MDGEPKNNPKPDLEEASQWLSDSPLDRRAVNRNIHSSISGAGSTGVQIHIMMNKLVKKWGGPDRSVPKSVVTLGSTEVMTWCPPDWNFGQAPKPRYRTAQRKYISAR